MYIEEIPNASRSLYFCFERLISVLWEKTMLEAKVAHGEPILDWKRVLNYPKITSIRPEMVRTTVP